RRPHAPALPQMRSNSRGLGDVSERPVAIVVKQPIRHPLINLWNAIMPSAVLMDPARLVLLLAKIYKLAQKKTQQPIIVVIKPPRAGSPPGRRHSRLFR